MEPEKFILWSARASGWLGRGGNYVSDRAQAEEFTFEKAIDMCKLHKGNRAEFGLLPVSLENLKVI